MRIVIDLQGAQSASRFRGIGRYSLNLVLALLELNQSHDVYVVLNSAFAESADELIGKLSCLLPPRHIKVFRPVGVLDWQDPGNHRRAMASEVIREAFVAALKPDVVLVTSLFEGYQDSALTSVGPGLLASRTAVVHYDLIPLLYDGYLTTDVQRIYYQRKLEQLKNAGKLLAISRHSKDEAIKALGLSEDRIVNISAAVSLNPVTLRNSSPDPAQLSALGICSKFILCVPGGFDPRKNIEGLISAYATLEPSIQNTHQLVIASKIDDGRLVQLKSHCASEGIAQGRVLLLGYVDEDSLCSLYAQTSLFVFPSTHEGFGLPVLEAMTCGAPVIGANQTSIPEIIGDPEALFDAQDLRAMTRAIERGLTDEVFRERLRLNAVARADQFSWRKTAAGTMAALEELAIAQPAEQDDDPWKAVEEKVSRVLGPAGTEYVEMAMCLAANCRLRDRPSLFLDVTELNRSDGKSGIQRVVRSLLRVFLSNPPEGYETVPVYFDGRQFRAASKFLTGQFGGLCATHAESASADAALDVYEGDVYLSLDLNMHAMPKTLPLMQQWARCGVSICFVVYDLLPSIRPDWWPSGIGERFEEWLTSLLSVATVVACISKSVAVELEAWQRERKIVPQLKAPEISWFHLGADIENSTPSSGLPNGFFDIQEAMRTKPSFLMVGTIEPRKGHRQALAAFELLWSRGVDVNLIVVGKPGWLADDLIDSLSKHQQTSKRLWWIANASDECLEQLYGFACCLIAASEAEGFGLPLIEAAQHGLPVIARDIPIFREVASDYAEYFDGPSREALADCVERWLLTCNDDGGNVKRTSLSHLTWRQSAQQLIEVLPLKSHETGGSGRQNELV